MLSLLRVFRSSRIIQVQTRLLSLDNNDKPATPFEIKLEADKKKLQWRVPPHEKPNEWYSKFKLFEGESSNSDLLLLMQQPIDLRPSSIKRWFERRSIRMEKSYQKFIPERHQVLGNDLAAAHFLVHRGGSVRCVGQSKWIKQDDKLHYLLPTNYIESWKLEAIRCDDMELYYEGLENIRRLTQLKFLSFHNVKTFDDWCLDRVSGSQFDALEILDLSGTNVTALGLVSLYRVPSLKMLIVDDVKKSTTFELVCAELEAIFPKLRICDASTIHDTNNV